MNQAHYEKDLADCRQLATNAPGTDAKKAGEKTGIKTGLLAGAGIVAFTVATGGLGAIALLPAVAGTAAVTAGGTGVALGAASSEGAKSKYEYIIQSCLRERGYHVVVGG